MFPSLWQRQFRTLCDVLRVGFPRCLGAAELNEHLRLPARQCVNPSTGIQHGEAQRSAKQHAARGCFSGPIRTRCRKLTIERCASRPRTLRLSVLHRRESCSAGCQRRPLGRQRCFGSVKLRSRSLAGQTGPVVRLRFVVRGVPITYCPARSGEPALTAGGVPYPTLWPLQPAQQRFDELGAICAIGSLVPPRAFLKFRCNPVSRHNLCLDVGPALSECAYLHRLVCSTPFPLRNRVALTPYQLGGERLEPGRPNT